MPDMILDGKGKGYKAKVDSDNRLRTYSKSASIQHVVSEHEEQAYQIIGTATLSSGTVTVLHMKNTSSNSNMVITYLRHQVVGATGGTSFPNTSNYFTVGLTRTYASGGSTATPVNVFGGSGNTAEVTAYQSGPTLAGTAQEIDRWYTKSDGDMNTFNKEGALIIPPNQTMEVSYVGDRTGGTIYARISFIIGS
jgi:hypothetical protein